MMNTSKHKADFNENWYVEFGTQVFIIISSLGCIIYHALDDEIKINILGSNGIYTGEQFRATRVL